jgi:hypothetical protein
MMHYKRHTSRVYVPEKLSDAGWASWGAQRDQVTSHAAAGIAADFSPASNKKEHLAG